MERFLLLVIVVSSRLPPREKEEEHRTSDADADADAARMWSCVRAKREERERDRERPLFLFSVLMRCAFALVELFLFCVVSKKNTKKKRAREAKNTQTRQKKTNNNKKKIAHAFDRKPAHSSTLPYGLYAKTFDRTGVRTRDLWLFTKSQVKLFPSIPRASFVKNYSRKEWFS